METTRKQSLANLAAVLAMMPDVATELDERVESFAFDQATYGDGEPAETFDRLDALVDLYNRNVDDAAERRATRAERVQANREARRLVRCLAAAGYFRPIDDAGIADIKRRTVSTGRLSLDVEFPRDDAGQRYTSDDKSFSTWLEDLK